MLVVNNSKDNCPGQFQPRTGEAFHLCCDLPTIFCLLARPVTSKLPIHLGFPSSSSSLAWELDWVGGKKSIEWKEEWGHPMWGAAICTSLPPTQLHIRMAG